jgi:hypothetical protein
MKPKYRLELGRLNANEIGVTATPRIGEGARRFYMANRAQAIMSDWADQIDLQDIYDEQNQHLLYYGMVGLHLYKDELRRQATIEPVPGPQLFPLPFDSTNPRKLDGLMRVQVVTRQWLELQDEILAAKLGHEDFPHMAQEAGQYFRGLGDSLVGLTSLDDPTSSLEGAVLINFWLNPTERNPSGQHGVIVNDRMYRYVSGYDNEGRSLALLGGNQDGQIGKIPIEIIYHTKVSDDFWGYGFCESLIALQRERNRQLSNVIKSAQQNKPFFGYDPNSVDPKDILDSDSILLPIRNATQDNKPPFWHFPAQAVSRDVGAILNIVSAFTDQAANHESGVLFGRQEGRTEGGPATERLHVNANTPLQTVVQRVERAWSKVFPLALDLLKDMWPDEKVVRTTGRLTLGREIRIKKEDVPWSNEVELTPNPMFAGGRDALLQLLFALRNMPADDGQGPELKSHEFRNALRKMGINIPGLDLHSKEVARNYDRIELLIGDGQTPQIPPASEEKMPELAMEQHNLAISLLKEKMLDISFAFMSPQVRNALFEQIKFHRAMVDPTPPDQFDDDIERADGQQQEAILKAGEDDLSAFEGQFTVDGIPIGA